MGDDHRKALERICAALGIPVSFFNALADVPPPETAIGAQAQMLALMFAKIPTQERRDQVFNLIRLLAVVDQADS